LQTYKTYATRDEAKAKDKAQRTGNRIQNTENKDKERRHGNRRVK